MAIKALSTAPVTKLIKLLSSHGFCSQITAGKLIIKKFNPSFLQMKLIPVKFTADNLI